MDNIWKAAFADQKRDAQIVQMRDNLCVFVMIFDRHANLKYKFGNRHFWSEGYYVSTVGLNEATIKKYIQDQEKYDIMQDKLSVKEYEDPFRAQREELAPSRGRCNASSAIVT